MHTDPSIEYTLAQYEVLLGAGGFGVNYRRHLGFARLYLEYSGSIRIRLSYNRSPKICRWYLQVSFINYVTLVGSLFIRQKKQLTVDHDRAWSIPGPMSMCVCMCTWYSGDTASEPMGSRWHPSSPQHIRFYFRNFLLITYFPFQISQFWILCDIHSLLSKVAFPGYVVIR